MEKINKSVEEEKKSHEKQTCESATLYHWPSAFENNHTLDPSPGLIHETIKDMYVDLLFVCLSVDGT